MSKGINIIKKIKVKDSLLKGKSYKQSMIDAGYSVNTAIHASDEGVLKSSLTEIAEELQLKDCTTDYFIKKREAIIKKATDKGDYTNALRGLEGQERISGIDKATPLIANVYQVSSELSKDSEKLTELLTKRLTQSQTSS